jgi:hypothetical protein
VIRIVERVAMHGDVDRNRTLVESEDRPEAT